MLVCSNCYYFLNNKLPCHHAVKIDNCVHIKENKFGNLQKKLGSIIHIQGDFLNDKLLDQRGDLFKVTHVNNEKLKSPEIIVISTRFYEFTSNGGKLTLDELRQATKNNQTLVGYECMRMEGVPQNALDYLNISSEEIKNRNRKKYSDLPDYGDYYTFEVISILK